MGTVYMDVRGPKALAEVVTTIKPSAPPPTDRFTATVDFGQPRLEVKVEFEKRDLWPYAVDIDGCSTKEINLHNAALRILKKLARKRWDVRVVPTFTEVCGADMDCPVCHWVSKDPMLDSIELAYGVVAEADLDDSLRTELDLILGSANPETIIATAVLGTRSALSPYWIGRIRQIIALGVYGSDRERQLIDALAKQTKQTPQADERATVGESIAAELSRVVDLTEADRDSMNTDIDAGDFESAIFDGVTNARLKLPPWLLTRIRDMSNRGWFGESTDLLAEAIKWHECQTDTVV